MATPIGGIEALELNFWGLAVATALLGVSIFQGYVFFSHYNDSFRLRLFVGILLLLDLTTTLFYSFDVRTIVIVNWGQELNLRGTTLAMVGESAATLIVTFLTQLFFAFRVYQVDQNKRISPALIVLFAFLAIAAGMTRVHFMAVSNFEELTKAKYKVANACEGAFSAISDVLATIAMCMTFVHTAMISKRLDAVLKYLLLYTFNRGIIVTSAQILMVVLYLIAPQKFYWAPVHLCLGKLYVNTLLAMLNSRARLRLRLPGTFLIEESTKISVFDHSTQSAHHVPSAGVKNPQPSQVRLEEAVLVNMRT
ncbi:hypothetical protein BD410DRAFT_255091 [Rickenella mellea]|uniref:DUF6534 domain-containing protein n=1 Tax=Rickenella mellea TaxID=50990 RepID=A0A4Y7QMU8_9AGAM|nr:hypothetical protein BD410DRAFT_255091 [Rickenella mellea]